MVKKDSRSRGRPRHFDEAEALHRATHVFWEKGYDGATIDDLVEAMGVGRPSLYSVFGDKAEVFMRCLELYRNRLGGEATKALHSFPDIYGSIHGLLRYTVENATGEGSPWGCLMVCVAPLVQDDRVRAFVAEGGKFATIAVTQRLQKAVDDGELPKEFTVAIRARQTLDLARGLTVRARIGAVREELLADAEEGARLIVGFG